MKNNDKIIQMTENLEELTADVKELKITVASLHDDFIKRTVLLKVSLWLLSIITTIATSVASYHIFH